MSQSLDIIRHILDENLIDAKKATEGYLNDILSGAIKEQYKEVAPSLVEKADGGKGGPTVDNTMASAPGAETAAIQQGAGEPFDNQSDAVAYIRANFTGPDGTLNTSIESIIAQAIAAGFLEAGDNGASFTFLLNALSNVPTEGPDDGGSVSDPISVAGRPESGDPDGFGGVVGTRGGGSNPLGRRERRERR
tara:strand:+ start:874 stop:1449 length:576 start_codon:yes stop_codon:yes gene_type:complete